MNDEGYRPWKKRSRVYRVGNEVESTDELTEEFVWKGFSVLNSGYDKEEGK